jgi:hypothetical protein
MLNDIIALLRRERVFLRLDRGHAQRILAEIARRSREEYDTNPAEILDGHSEALGLCSDCLEPAEGIAVDMCRKCRAEAGYTEDDLRRWKPRYSSWFLPEKKHDDEQRYAAYQVFVDLDRREGESR